MKFLDENNTQIVRTILVNSLSISTLKTAFVDNNLGVFKISSFESRLRLHDMLDYMSAINTREREREIGDGNRIFRSFI